MSINRRKFLGISALGSGALAFTQDLFGKSRIHQEIEYDLPKAIRDLKPMIDDVVPISVEERKQRIVKAQQLMDQQRIDAIFMEGTASSFYFTGMRWGQTSHKGGNCKSVALLVYCRLSGWKRQTSQ